jgi:hypothetical protein
MGKGHLWSTRKVNDCGEWLLLIALMVSGYWLVIVVVNG